jgi:hypothetical protein
VKRNLFLQIPRREKLDFKNVENKETDFALKKSHRAIFKYSESRLMLSLVNDISRLM